MSRVIFNGGAAQHFPIHLGVDVLGLQQGRAGVPKVVEAGGVSPAFLRRGLEGVSGGVIGTISEPVASDTSFCLLCEGGVAAFIYVRLIARRVGVRIVTGSERRR
jgi:hypothetical protein